MSIGDNIRKRRLELGMSQEDLASRVGYTSRSTINKIEMGVNEITHSKITAIANALCVSPYALMQDEHSQTSKDDNNIIIPILNTLLCEENELFTRDNIVDRISIPSSFLFKGKRKYFALYSGDNSMSNCDINEGDLLICILSNTIKDGNMGIFGVNGEEICRKYKVINNKLWLLPANENYAPIEVTEAISYRCLGICITKLSKL